MSSQAVTGAHAAYDWSRCRALSQHQLASHTATRPSPQISALARVVITRTVALAPTLLVALLANAPNQLDVLNQWLNILQSIQLPFAIIPVRPHGCVTSNYACLVVTAW